MSYSLNIREVTYALSGALDYVGIDDTHHGKRVAYMAAALAQELSWKQDIVDDIIFAGMLHDCGVSSTDVHTHLVNELDWDNSQVHCIRGEILLKSTNIYGKFSEYIKYHHTHWQDLSSDLNEDVKNISNLIYLVDRVDALRTQIQVSGVESIYAIQETIKKFSNKMFSPMLVEAFMTVSSKDSFWFYLETEALSEYFILWTNKGNNEPLSYEQVKEIALMFAAVVDAKSEFTSQHSLGVSVLARYLAELFDLSLERCEEVELAGLLHDLGKLKVEDAILDKPSKLNADERLKMNRHGFDSYIILRHIEGFKKIAKLASLHHETLDAKGYPYNLSAAQIPLEGRIITVSDIFQALIQDRPYRDGLSADEAFNIINTMCEDGKLDFVVVQKLKENLHKCYELATVKG
ncbi:MAG: HD domain-containing protein [Thiovulaceae bacterium]|nr:HD domain-containing protein [Sulfurimonadaceae bacterium]